jgi:hypothetical protein
MACHVVLMGPVDHDGTRYEEGAELPLSIDAAAALVAVGVAREVQSAAKEAKPRKPAG